MSGRLQSGGRFVAFVRLRYPLNWRLVGLQRRSGPFRKRKSLAYEGNGTQNRAEHILLVIIHTALSSLPWKIISS